ncbi:UNVERIFIED_ORG: hypothetical protein M2328_005765 [Rhodococcus erythropolis]
MSGRMIFPFEELPEDERGEFAYQEVWPYSEVWPYTWGMSAMTDEASFRWPGYDKDRAALSEWLWKSGHRTPVRKSVVHRASRGLRAPKPYVDPVAVAVTRVQKIFDELRRESVW